jgi:hypothetical protein
MESCSIETVQTLEELLAGEFVIDCLHPLNPNCKHTGCWKYLSSYVPEVGKAAAIATNHALETQTCCKEQNRIELRNHVHAEFARILSKPAKWEAFLRHENKGGFLYKVAQNVCRKWLHRRAKQAAKDKRVREMLETGRINTLPLKHQFDPLKFDRFQFDGRRRARAIPDDDVHTPHRRAGRGLALTSSQLKGTEEPTLLSQYKPPVSPEEKTEAAQQYSLEIAIEEHRELSRIRKAIDMLPEDDADFVTDYVSTKGKVKHTDAERKRFQRLVPKVKFLMQTVVMVE